jgi:hypothetical protein
MAEAELDGIFFVPYGDAAGRLGDPAEEQPGRDLFFPIGACSSGAVFDLRLQMA